MKKRAGGPAFPAQPEAHEGLQVRDYFMGQLLTREIPNWFGVDILTQERYLKKLWILAGKVVETRPPDDE